MNRTLRLLQLSLTCALLVFPIACSDDEPQTEPASVEITYPEDGDLVTEDRIRVKGTAENSDTVTVNGEETEVVGGEWDVLGVFEQGEVTATATAGDAEDTVTFTVDSNPPQLTLDSPERGLYVEASSGDTVTVSGSVQESGTGLQLLKVDEQIIHPDESGNFSIEWPLEEGLNEISVTALDRAGNEADTIRGVMYGDFVDPTSSIDPGFNIFVRDAAFDAVETVIAEIVTPTRVQSFIDSSFMSDTLTVDAITFDPIDVEITPKNGSIDIAMTITNADLDGTVTLNGEDHAGSIEISRVVVEVNATPVVTEDGGFDLEFGEATLDLKNEDLSFTLGGDPLEVDTVRDIVANLARTAFADLLSDRVFDELFDPEILKRRIELLGRELTFEVKFKEIEVFSDGIFAALTVSLPAEKFEEVRDVPGAINRPPSAGSGPETTNDIIFESTQNAMDRLLHGVWRSGLLHQRLEGDDFGGMELPFELTSDALAAALDSRVSSLAPSGTPAGIRLRPLLPPVFEVDVENSGLVIEVGEVLVDFVLLPSGQEPITVATTSMFLDLDVSVAVDGVTIDLGFSADLRADVAAEPEFDLDDKKTEETFQSIFALVPAVIEQSLDLAGVADVSWLTLESPQIEVYGEEEDRMAVSLTLEPNPDGLEE